MFATLFLPDPTALALEQATLADHQLTLTVRTTAPTACCPTCAAPTSRVHSRYRRTVADLPSAGHAVRFDLRCRRFFCANPACPRRTFSERLPTIIAPAARRTVRQATHLQHTGLRAGGETGARLLVAAGIPVSPDTVLRAIRRTPDAPAPTPRVLGVDDWARRKGHTYGTILCNLETHQVIDVLADRTAETLATWLRTHPGVEIISRDRAGAYAEGARLGAPQARQVADRFHLLCNLGDALEEVLVRIYPALLAALTAPLPSAQGDSPPPPTVSATPLPLADPPSGDPLLAATTPPRRRLRDVERSQARRTARQARYAEVRRLHELGWNQSAIARQLDLDRATVRKWIGQDTFPELQPRAARPRQFDGYRAYLARRWTEGCHNARQLWQELRQQGYRGGYSSLAGYITELRQAAGLPLRHGTAGNPHAPVPPVVPRPRQLKWLLLRPVADWSDDEYALVQRLCAASTDVTVAYGLVTDFMALVRQRQPEHLASWVELAQASAIPELGSFARGIVRDWAAVQAGLELDWNQGQVEGQVNRLKMLKRSMYGRAKLDLLRLRVLYAH